jgi:hypothetical protein
LGTVTIPLTKGQHTTIDEEDLPLLGHYKWQALRTPSGNYYAVRTQWTPDGKSHRVAMHRVIAGALDGEEVDHWDGDGLNNTRQNLRRTDKAHNQANRGTPRSNRWSGYKGVVFDPKRVANPWQAYIGTDSERESLGSYDTAEKAAEAYNRAAIVRYGEFARLNEIDYDNPIPRPDMQRPRHERPAVAAERAWRGIPRPGSGAPASTSIEGASTSVASTP